MTASKQTRLKLRKGFTNAPLQYRVLMVAEFSDKDIKTISKGLIKATTPDNAKPLLPTPKDLDLPKEKRSRWSMERPTTGNGTYDIHVLKYKGLEVAVFYRRATHTIEPEPMDPVPVAALRDPDDVWVRLELFNKSPRQLVGKVREEMQEQTQRISSLENEVATLRSLKEHETKQLRDQVERLKRELAAVNQTKKRGKTK